MKFFHTADWHLGKSIQGMRMIDDQQYILEQFIEHVKKEQPDAVIIAGDLYDRQIPPTEAVELLNDVLEKIVVQLNVPVLAIGGNHDSPSRLNFANKMMQQQGLHIIGQLKKEIDPVILRDEFGDVHFHLIPYVDPTDVRNMFNDETIKTHDDAFRAIVNHVTAEMNENVRHVFVGHAFVTPYGKERENTSESERPLSIGGAEYVNANHFTPFHYTALGHLHRAHYVQHEYIRYAGSILKYSISEENHEKGFYIVELDELGQVTVEKKRLIPRREMRTVKGKIEDLLQGDINDDYVFVHLLDETTVLSPMEKIRSVYPNAMHITRENFYVKQRERLNTNEMTREKMSDTELFHAFYKEVKGIEPSAETEALFTNILEQLMLAERKK